MTNKELRDMVQEGTTQCPYNRKDTTVSNLNEAQINAQLDFCLTCTGYYQCNKVAELNDLLVALDNSDKCCKCGIPVKEPRFDENENTYCEDCFIDRVCKNFIAPQIKNLEVIRVKDECLGEITDEFKFTVAYEGKKYFVKGYVIDYTEEDTYNISIENEAGECLAQAYVDSEGGMEGSESLSVGIPIVDRFIMYVLFVQNDCIIKGF